MSEPNSNPSQQPNKKPNNRWRWLSWVLYSAAFFLLAVWMFGGDTYSSTKDLSYTKFSAYIENDAIKSITVYDNNKAKALVVPTHYVLVFGEQAKGEQAKGEITSQIPSVEEFSKYIDGINGKRKDLGKTAIDIRYEKSRDTW